MQNRSNLSCEKCRYFQCWNINKNSTQKFTKSIVVRCNELKTILNNYTFDIVSRPFSQNCIGNKFVLTRDGLDIRKISDIRSKTTRYLVNLPGIWLYIAYHFLGLEIHNGLYCRNFSKFIFLLVYLINCLILLRLYN